MIKIAMIGAGSTVFMKNILTDVLLEDCFKKCAVALHDIDPKRLKTSELVARKIADAAGAAPVIEAVEDRRAALKGADFVIVMIQVGDYRTATAPDFEIPAKYGLKQTIADTLGAGGVMRGLRTAPVLADIARDMLDICPDALMLQYVNPMAINCLALSRLTPELKYAGLCHSVQGTAIDLARDLGEPADAIEYECAGINHMAFYTKFAKRSGSGALEDLYPRLRALIDTREYGANYDGCANHVRYEALRRLGYFVTESSEHFAEYTPWFIKNSRPDLIEKFEIPVNEYMRRCEKQAAEWDAQEKDLLSDKPLRCEKSIEYAARIIHAVVNNASEQINANVMNDGYIGNLPVECCVETPCRIDADGVTPQTVPDLPPHLAALMMTNINVQLLTVEALITGKKEHVYHAVMLDPHTGAELSLDQIWRMVDELLEAHADRLPELR